jgi:hypothetical protein
MARSKASPARKPDICWSANRAAVRNCKGDTSKIVKLSTLSRVNIASEPATSFVGYGTRTVIDALSSLDTSLVVAALTNATDSR